MPRFKVVVLQQLFVVKVSVLCLDRIKLVAECQVILVPLLDLEDFSLKLGHQEVLLVTRQVN